MTEKIDFKRELACYSARGGVPEVVDVPDLRYLMIDGHGDPNTPVYEAAVSALSDPRRTDPAKLRTILRQPVTMA